MTPRMTRPWCPARSGRSGHAADGDRDGRDGPVGPASRTATVGPASLVMPDAPYVLYPDPMRLTGVLDVLFCSSATVHQRYDGRHALVGRRAARPGRTPDGAR